MQSYISALRYRLMMLHAYTRDILDKQADLLAAQQAVYLIAVLLQL